MLRKYAPTSDATVILWPWSPLRRLPVPSVVSRPGRRCRRTRVSSSGRAQLARGDPPASWRLLHLLLLRRSEVSAEAERRRLLLAARAINPGARVYQLDSSGSICATIRT